MTNTTNFIWQEALPGSVYQGFHSKKVSAIVQINNLNDTWTLRLSTEDHIYRKSDFATLDDAKNFCEDYFATVLSKEA